MPKPRVVSLIASATEIVCSLGMESALVGRSHECDYPPSVKTLPLCTSPKFNVHGSSAEIDQRVKETLQTSLSVYNVDADLLRSLRPDVIVTQTQCNVCAVSENDVLTALASWLDTKPQVVSLSPDSLADVWTDIERVADALHIADGGRTLVGQMRDRMDAVAAKAGTLAKRPLVACIEWIEPLMAAGHWMPELVEIAGGTDAFGKPGMHAPPLTWEHFRSADPEVIVVMPCGLDMPRTIAEMPALERKTDWQSLRAVRSGQVYVADGNQFFNRPGPRLVESLEILAEIVHPAGFHFGHEGTGWQREMRRPS